MFWDNFVRLCNKVGKYPNTVAAEVGVKSTGTVTGWKNGAKPRQSILKKLCDYFGVTEADLMGDDSAQKEKPTAQGGRLISDLPENIQELISICLQNPDFTVLLLNLAQRMQNPPADQA